MDRADKGIIERAANLSAIGATVDFAERLQRNDTLCHRTVAATDAHPNAAGNALAANGLITFLRVRGYPPAGP